MTDRDILYRAILDSPEDDTLRLVYADALEESGDPPRAAFIRAQVALSHLPEFDPLWVQARAQGQDQAFDPEWLEERELPEGINWAGHPFRRGLPGAIQARDGATFVAHADELFLRYPIEALELRVVRPQDTREFPECSWLTRLTSLWLVQGVGGEMVRRLLASQHLTGLRELRVGSQLTTPATVAAIVRSKVFKQLTSLAVRSDQRDGGRLAGELARLANPPRLTKLDLSGNRLTAEAIAPLVASEAVATVEDLNLSDNTLDAVGLEMLARGELPALRSLHLLRTRPQEGGVNALAAADFFPELRSLSLGGNNLGPPAAFVIANSRAENLRVLDLRENRIGDRGAIALAESSRLTNLIELDLAESHIGDAGAETLADSPNLAGLLSLNLSGNRISDGVADRLRARFGDRVFR